MSGPCVPAVQAGVKDPSAVTPRSKGVQAAGTDKARRKISIEVGTQPLPNSRAKGARGASEEVGSAGGQNQISKDIRDR